MNKSNIPSPTNPVPIEKQMDYYQDLGIDLMVQDIANSNIVDKTDSLLERLKLSFNMPLYTNNTCFVSKKDLEYIIDYLQNSISKQDLLKEIKRIEYDVNKTRELKRKKKENHELTDYDKNRLGAYITKSNEIAKRLKRLLESW